MRAILGADAIAKSNQPSEVIFLNKTGWRRSAIRSVRPDSDQLPVLAATPKATGITHDPIRVLLLMQANLVRYLVLLDGHVRRSG